MAKSKVLINLDSLDKMVVELEKFLAELKNVRQEAEKVQAMVEALCR